MKITAAVKGIRSWSQACKTMNAATRADVSVAVHETTTAVEAKAQMNVPVSGANSRKAKGRPGPGELRATIRAEFSEDGLAGFVRAGNGKLPRRSRRTKAIKLGPLTRKAYEKQQARIALQQERALGSYAMVINYGSPGRGIPGSHYMDRAKESERTAHITRVTRALAHAADTTTAAGS
jgi:hypothetical protein